MRQMRKLLNGNCRHHDGIMWCLYVFWRIDVFIFSEEVDEFVAMMVAHLMWVRINWCGARKEVGFELSAWNVILWKWLWPEWFFEITFYVELVEFEGKFKVSGLQEEMWSVKSHFSRKYSYGYFEWSYFGLLIKNQNTIFKREHVHDCKVYRRAIKLKN